MKVEIAMAEDGATFWRVRAANNRKLATAGERFYSRANTKRAFTLLADGIRNMTDEQYAAFMLGLKAKK